MLELLVTALLAVVAGPGDAAFTSARAAYFEDETGRRAVAEVGAALLGSPRGDVLVVTLAAIGPRVDGADGWDGISGANVVTARELGRLLDEDRVRVTVDGAPASSTRVRVLARARVPVRRFESEAGRFVETATPRLEPVVVGIAVGGLPQGSHVTQVVVDGLPRLSVEHERRGAHARIGGIASLGGRILR